ncbi:restriction endonuclease subunit S [Microbacterium sp. F2]|uniref:restriction endonuclease subunit S n=1 Tax=Microbacterium sp. F2 TaxID=3422228 RepID=UPI003FD35486
MPLGEVVSPVSGRAGARELPVYSVTKHSGFVPSTDYFKKQVFSQDLSTYKVVEKGQFAYATIHLDEGSIGVAPEACVISPMYTVFSVDQSRVDAGYLIRLMKSPTAVAQYSRLGRGTAERRKSISLEALGRLGVHLPPLPEQRRIAAILDEADARRSARHASLRLLRAVPGEVLAARDSRGWKSVSLGDVASLQGGLTVSARRATLPRRAGYLRVANVFRGAIDLTEIKDLGVTQAELERTRIRLGDLLVVEGHGNLDEVGRAALVTELPSADLTHQNHLFRLRPNAERVLGRFLELVLNSSDSREYFRRVANTTSGLNTLNATSVRSLRMRLAPPAIQDEVVREVDGVSNSIRAAERSSAQLDELFASLQHRAFRGEL